MSLYITIDGGTTNTRINLVKNKQLLETVKIPFGAKNNIENKSILSNQIKQAIIELLARNQLVEADICRILASGMITSEFGLCLLDHIETPAGIKELHESIFEVNFDEISQIPFVFIRGVKTDASSFDKADMMRGEETELMGIISSEYGNCVYVLPGSHSKIIETSSDGKIINFSTMLTGEMIGAISKETILKDSVDLEVQNTDTTFLLNGYDYTEINGINKALFKVRTLKNLFNASQKEIYSFFLGSVLCGEIKEIKKLHSPIVVIGGKMQLKNAIAEILEHRSNKKIVVIDEAMVDFSTSLGAVRVFEG